LGEEVNGQFTLEAIQCRRLLDPGAADKNDWTQYTLLAEAFQHANIHVKVHHHPLKLKGHTLGSFHEKYVVSDDKEAAVGVIDFQPNRCQEPSHDWKMDGPGFAKL